MLSCERQATYLGGADNYDPFIMSDACNRFIFVICQEDVVHRVHRATTDTTTIGGSTATRSCFRIRSCRGITRSSITPTKPGFCVI